MRISGTDATELTIEDEYRRTPDAHEWWQDSVVLCWWDLAQGIGGYHRIGHRPFSADGPVIDLSNNIFTNSRVLKRCEVLPLREEDKLASGGFGGGDGTCTYEFTDHGVWTFDQPELSGQLHLRDFHPPVDIYPKGGQLAERITSGHLEAACGITGDLMFDGTDFKLDGLAFRDRGWGKRYWEEILGHRWVVANFGPDVTVMAVSVLGVGELFDFGCVIRQDELVYASEIEVVTYLERDCLTHTGGHVSMQLPDGEQIEIEAEVLQKGAISFMAERAAINDTMCKATWGDRVGICNFEISNNALAGTTKPRVALNGVLEDGLHRYALEN